MKNKKTAKVARKNATPIAKKNAVKKNVTKEIIKPEVERHGVTHANILEFYTELKTLLTKYNALPANNGALTIKTANLKLIGKDCAGCPEECKKYKKVCEPDGSNCTVECYCTC